MGLGDVIRGVLALAALVLGTMVLVPPIRRRYFANVYRTSRPSRWRIVGAWRALAHTWPFEGTILVLFGAGNLVKLFSLSSALPDPVLLIALWARTLGGLALVILFVEASFQPGALPSSSEDRRRPNSDPHGRP